MGRAAELPCVVFRVLVSGGGRGTPI